MSESLLAVSCWAIVVVVAVVITWRIDEIFCSATTALGLAIRLFLSLILSDTNAPLVGPTLGQTNKKVK